MIKMWRPEAKYYEPSVDEYAFEHYVEDLEKYCDRLEKKLEDSYLIDVLNRLEKTEKALDKACLYLEAYTCNDQFPMCRYKDQWKEWLMKDEL